MATLIPALGSCLSKMTSGEKRFANRLEDKLEDDYLLWYDVPIGRSGVHPDFIVLHPMRGILILEVKDWRLDTIQSMDKVSTTLLTQQGIKSVANPLEQARHYAHTVCHLLERDAQLLKLKVENMLVNLPFRGVTVWSSLTLLVSSSKVLTLAKCCLNIVLFVKMKCWSIPTLNFFRNDYGACLNTLLIRG